ncbi:YqgE/AlgH family protein [Rhabdochromatium marinum]|uniref:YqgE/AlgH family protein n=1 Tax=Rhabdochromatium marinum TaxID=48729 RepID=UPI0019043D8C|nr:YqgE/AlgH family protein [Rhabdochromatium marinum]MBK1649425.1 hypothetical protein [Rhabdochromatium marinum]
MSVSTSLTNQFLIAMPGLQDPNFSRTVTYVCEHNTQGAMGIIINRPMDLRLGDVLEQLDIEPEMPRIAEQIVYQGGPVQTDRGFVIHAGADNFDSTLMVTPDLRVTTSRDILEALAKGTGPEHCLVALGYAGWTSGQLEKELSANTWLSGPIDHDTLFKAPASERLQAAAQLIGIDLNLLSGEAGHA